MSEVRLPRGNAYSADAGAERGRRSSGSAGGDELRMWLVGCMALSLTSGVLGWKIGSADGDKNETKEMASARVNPAAGAWSAVVTTPPFVKAGESANGSAAPPSQPPFPYTVLRGYNDQNQPITLLERDGERFVVNGPAVHGDYLIQLERDEVVFRYLPSAVRRTVSLPAVAPEVRVQPRAGGDTHRPTYRTPSSLYQTNKPPENSADEEAERD